MDDATRTLCPFCGVGCGLRVGVRGGRVRSVAGDPLHPASRGRTCRKPLELGHAVHAADRALTPLMRARRDARFERVGWDRALGDLAARLRALAPGELGFYISGQLLTEDYYAINKLAKGFLGCNNVDSNSRLCMSSAVAGYKGAFGSDGPPCSYEDLALADCLLLAGSNAAACHPIVWGRIRDRQAEGATVICLDPRPTATARAADLHLPLRPGTDLALLSAMLGVIARDGLVDEPFVARRTSGWEAALASASEWTPERAAAVCGVPAADVERAAHAFGGAGRAMALWSMGANQSTVGTLKNRALINLCLATGNVGRPGGGPFSLTGQPNAMGGRETGGLAHLLPGYRELSCAEDRAALEAHWGLRPGAIAPEPGLPAVELFSALASGRVKAVWIVATNPIVSLPGPVRTALERAELVVVSDAHHPTETSALADVVLPAAAWPEKTGTMTSSERRVGLVQAALSPPGEALPDWRIVARLAAALGCGDAFAWPDAAAVYDEYAACTAGRPCDVGGLSHARLRREGPLQWPCPAVAGAEGTPRLYADRRFPTPDGRARFAPTPHAEPAETPDADYPLLLTSGRIADQWHTMTRTGKSSTLRAAAGEPFVELPPSACVRDGEAVRVVSRRGAVVLRSRVVEGLPDGVAFAPFHWGALHAPPGAGALNAVTHDEVDAISAQPELKACAVRVEPVAATTSERSASRSGAVADSVYHAPRVVIVGAGMAGLAVAEAALARRPELSITMLGEEREPAYNRVLLSRLLAGGCGPGDLELRPAGWYAAHGVEVRTGCAAVAIDAERRTVLDAAGECHPYDALVLATGSRPVVPPIPGAEGLRTAAAGSQPIVPPTGDATPPHVVAFRTRADVERIATAARRARTAVVVGGGLLGLEAAAGLQAHGVRVTVVELADRLMAGQLDAGASAMLARALRGLGLQVRTGVGVARISPDHVALTGTAGAGRTGAAGPAIGMGDAAVPAGPGERVPAQLVVIAAGIRPEVALARDAGLEVAHGVVVDDAMRTSVPAVWAAGECAEHRGTVYGLWAPVAEQARVAGAGVAGDPAAFHGAIPATSLKVAGVEVYVGGAPDVPAPAPSATGAERGLADRHELVLSDTRRGAYRKLVLEDDRLTGVTLVGDTAGSARLGALLRSGEPVPDDALAGSATSNPSEPADTDVICACNGVTRGQLAEAIRAGGLTTTTQVSRATRAATGCGGCAGDVAAVLRSCSRNTTATAA